MNRIEITTRWVAVQTQVSGGVESDFRYYVFGNTIDEVLVMHDGTGDLYYAHDHLYSPVALFANNGTVVERYEYDVYGKVHILAPNYELRTASLYGNPYAFTGRELDILDAGSRTLMYYRARTYDPETGRFMQRDPLGVNPDNLISDFWPLFQYSDGTNVYQYVRSNAMAHTDPFGLIMHGPPPWVGPGIPDLIIDPDPSWKTLSVQTIYENVNWRRDYYGECTAATLGAQYKEYDNFETTRINTIEKTSFPWPVYGTRKTITDFYYGIADVYLITCECAGGTPNWVSRKQDYKSDELFYKRVITRQKKYHKYIENPGPFPRPPILKPLPPEEWAII